MVKIDLITGFLGSGKTTFIRKYAKAMMDRGENICILENDFGAVNVDMMLLQDLMGDNCDMEMVSGGCDADCHRRRFKTKLIAMGMQGFDRVLVEPSGIYDTDEFFDVLREDPVDRWYEIGNVYVVVDAKLKQNLSDEAEYLLAAQLANAGVVLLSRCQEATEQEIHETKKYLRQVMERFQCKEIEEDRFVCKDWDTLEMSDFESMMQYSYHPGEHKRVWFDEQETFSSVYFLNLSKSVEEVKERIQSVFGDPSCGKVFRIKGFTKNSEDQWVEINATCHEINIRPIKEGQDVIIVIGENINQAEIEKYWQ